MRRALPPLNALRAFEAAARHGRMTAAAAELHVTHGAVSRHVRHLEALLGVRLFEGPKTGLTLTEAGLSLLPRLTAAFGEIEAAVRAVADRDEGPLDVSCTSTFAMRWLLPRLHRFNARHPAVAVRLAASEGLIDLARERFDVAIHVADAVDATAVVLLGEEVGPVMVPALARGARLAAPADLARIPLLHTSTRRRAWHDWCRDVGIPTLAGGSVFGHFYFMLEAATAGLGTAIAPWPLVIDDIAAGRLVAPFGFRPSGKSYVVLRRRRQDQKAEAFCGWLAEEARRTPRPPAAARGAHAPRPSRGQESGAARPRAGRKRPARR
jgi:LysR family glycine cleavage system transcriptional activator